MEFSNDWFKPHEATWRSIIPQYNPRKILEVGSFEGQSISFLIGLLGSSHPLEISCVDTWEGGQEHAGTDMGAVEARFDRNVGEAIGAVSHPVVVNKVKSTSDLGLAYLLAQGKQNYFDLVYIDGSHEAPDVLLDAALGFKLLRVGGLMIFDDYLWGQGPNINPLMSPKLGVDNFMNCFQGRIQCHPWMPNYQLYCRKLQS